MNSRDAYTLLCGDGDYVSALREGAPGQALPALPPFAPRALDFLSALSAALLESRDARSYPDAVTLAFFCRKANLSRLEQSHGLREERRLGRGLVFHIAPGNVPMNFAYSLAAALLAGNASIVKAPSRDYPQARLACRVMDSLLSGDFAPLRPYVNVIAYPREAQGLTEAFSAACDARIIWGGDATVRRVREAPLSPFATDVTFADRFSLLVVRPEAVAAMDEPALSAMAQGFYNDTFLTDQNACTAPRLVYWLTRGGPEAEAGRERFWQAVHAYAAPRYPIDPVIAVDKLTALCQAAVTLEGARRVPTADNLIARIAVDALTEALLDFRCPGGCFAEYRSPTLDGLAAIAGRRVQTLSYLGLEPDAVWALIRERGLRGIDRIVPLGQTLDFSLLWDGYDLIRALTRRVQTL